jgi:hypothetical protein
LSLHNLLILVNFSFANVSIFCGKVHIDDMLIIYIFLDGNYKKLTSEIIAEIETCLNEVRDEIFTKLQPQLRCTLGK